MNLASILALLSGMGPIVEPLLLNLDASTIQPELQALIASVSSPDLKLLLQSLDAGLDAFIKAELAKLTPGA